MRKIFSLIIVALAASLICSAKVSLPGIFADNMVLQQQSQVAFWGTAKAGSAVTVQPSWNKKNYSTKANSNGEWNLKIATPVAGGPFQVSVSDGEAITLKNILIGEVWVCSGQSNMEMPLRGNSSPILNASEIILHADNPQLRLYRIGRATSLTPVKDPKGKWEVSTSETARDYSALAFQFGQILQKKNLMFRWV